MTKRNKILTILVVVLLLPAIYAISFRYSLQKIDAFCDAVDGKVKTNDLMRLAGNAGVSLKGPFEQKSAPGVFTSMAVSAFTIGEYRCAVDSSSEYVTSKTLPSGDTIFVGPAVDFVAIQAAVEHVFTVQFDGGESAVIANLKKCYQGVLGNPKAGVREADICISQDIAYSNFADAMYGLFSKTWGNPQIKIQTPFTTRDAVFSRIVAALSAQGISPSIQKERIDHIDQFAKNFKFSSLKSFDGDGVMQVDPK